MKLRLHVLLLTSIAVVAGVIVLAGYFIELPYLADLRRDFLRWAVLLTAVAVIVGVANLIQVHWRKIKTRQSGGIYSFILIASLLVTLSIAALLGPTALAARWMYDYIQLPIGASLLGILAVLLTYAAARMLGRRPNVYSLVFLITALFFLMSAVSLPGGLKFPFLTDMRVWLEQVLVVSGVRGILLGIGLGTIATGLRVLLGVDRPYGG